MGIRLELGMTQNERDRKICEDYWAYDNKSGFIRHIKSLCKQYRLSSYLLFETIAECYACLDDVLCEYCGTACPVEVPADILHMRSKISWSCTVCENALWREHNINK